MAKQVYCEDFTGNTAEENQRYFVPAIGAPVAEDLMAWRSFNRVSACSMWRVERELSRDLPRSVLAPPASGRFGRQSGHACSCALTDEHSVWPSELETGLKRHMFAISKNNP